MDKKKLQKLIAASARRRADLCITNAHILDVFNKEWFEADLLISGAISRRAALPERERRRRPLMAGVRSSSPD